MFQNVSRTGTAALSLVATLALVAGCGMNEADDVVAEAPADGEAGSEPAVAEVTGDTGTATTATDGEVLQIGYAPSELDPTDFFGMFQLGLEQGLQDLGVEYELTARAPSNASAHDEQFRFVEDLITLDSDVIIIAPTEFEAQIGSYRAVNEADIPLFITNFSAPLEGGDFEVVQYAAYSHEEGGTVNGEWFAENLEPGTQVGVLRGIPGAVDDQRALPAIEAMEEAGIEVVAQEVANFDRDVAFRATQSMMAAHPEIEFIYAVNSGMAAGAIGALESSGITPGEEVGVWGFGGTVEELEAIIDGSQTGTVFRNPVEMGEAMAESIMLTMEGRQDEVEPEFNATMTVLTTCEDIVELVPPVTFGGEDEAPTLEDCS